MLTKEEILLILQLVGAETVVEPTVTFRYRISREGSGYSKDKKIGALQAKLSIMLEVATKRERAERE